MVVQAESFERAALLRDMRRMMAAPKAATISGFACVGGDFAPRVTPRTRAQVWFSPRAMREPLAILARGGGGDMQMSHRDGDYVVARFTDAVLGERTVYVPCRDVIATR